MGRVALRASFGAAEAPDPCATPRSAAPATATTSTPPRDTGHRGGRRSSSSSSSSFATLPRATHEKSAPTFLRRMGRRRRRRHRSESPCNGIAAAGGISQPGRLRLWLRRLLLLVVALSLLGGGRELPLPQASAEVVVLGDNRAAAELEASPTHVRYLIAAVRAVKGGGGGGSNGGKARIGLDRLRVGLPGDGQVVKISEFWDVKEEVPLRFFGDEGSFAGSAIVGGGGGAEDEGSSGGGGGGGGGHQIAAVDVAIFRIPAGCAYATGLSSERAGDACDWPEVGVGATVEEAGGDTTSTYYCCHSRAVKAGACRNASETQGRLILTGSFTGYHGAFSVTQGGGGGGGIWTGNVSAGTIWLPEPGIWGVAFAYCNERATRVVVLSGEIEFESYYGYLPAELFPYMALAFALAVLCSALFVWYLARMIRYAAARIPVEKWILAAIALAGLEACLQVVGYAVWNGTGYQSYRLAVAAMVAGALKSALGRCVLLTAALGWGVTKASLQCLTAAGVVLLGAATVPLELLVNLSLIHEVQDIQPQTFIGAMRIAADAADIVGGMEDFAYLVFALWTAAALAWTLWTLWRSRQTRKLGRYLRLSAVRLVSGLCAAVVVAVARSRVAGDVRYVLLRENAERAIFVLALAGVACLWRPNESAREYAYSTQLPTSEEEQEGEGEYDGGASDGLVLQQPPPAASSAEQTRNRSQDQPAMVRCSEATPSACTDEAFTCRHDVKELRNSRKG